MLDKPTQVLVLRNTMYLGMNSSKLPKVEVQAPTVEKVYLYLRYGPSAPTSVEVRAFGPYLSTVER